MAVNGIFANEAAPPGGLRPKVVDYLLKQRVAGKAPLLALMSKGAKKQEKFGDISWYETPYDIARFRVTTGVNSSATTLTLSDNTRCTPGMYLISELTAERVLITAVGSNNQITVLRGYQDSTAATIANDTWFMTIGSVVEEGSDFGKGVITLPYQRLNSMQTIRTSQSYTATAANREYLNGKWSLKDQAKAQLVDKHMREVELACLFSRRGRTVLNQKNADTMNGVEAQITTNVLDASVGMTRATFNDYLEQLFKFRTEETYAKPKYCLCGPGPLKWLEDAYRADGQQRIIQSETDKELGLRITTFHSQWGSLDFIQSPLFTETPLWQNKLLILQPELLDFYMVRNAKTVGPRTIESTGRDSEEWDMLSDLTVAVKQETSFGIINGMRTYSA